MNLKKSFIVNDLSKGTRYQVQSWEEGRDETDRHAIRMAQEHNDVITLGMVIVAPVSKFN